MQTLGDGYRHEAQRKAHCDKQDVTYIQIRHDRQYRLTQCQSQEGHDHVAGKYHSPLMGLGLLVQPAFKHHVLTHHRHAHQHAKYQPDFYADGKRVANYGSCHHSCTGDKCTDVPHPGYQSVPYPSAHHQTDVVARREHANPHLPLPFPRQAEPDIGAQETASDEH